MLFKILFFYQKYLKILHSFFYHAFSSVGLLIRSLMSTSINAPLKFSSPFNICISVANSLQKILTKTAKAMVQKPQCLETRMDFQADSLLFHLRLKHQGCQISEYQRPAYTGRAGGQASFKDSQHPVFPDGLLNPLPEGIAKSQKGYPCSCPGPFCKRLIYADGSKDTSGYYQRYHDSARHHFCLFHQDLHQSADKSSN